MCSPDASHISERNVTLRNNLVWLKEDRAVVETFGRRLAAFIKQTSFSRRGSTDRRGKENFNVALIWAMKVIREEKRS